MSRIKNLFFAFLLVLAASGTAPAAEIAGSLPVSYQHIIRHDPNLSIHIVTIDLTNPGVSLHVDCAGPAPKSGPWLTTLLPPSEIAARDHDDIAINGDFFTADNTRDIEGKHTGYIKGKAASPVGPAMSDGKLWCPHTTTRPVIEISKHDHVLIAGWGPHHHIAASVTQIIGGNPIILRDGKKPNLTSRFATARNPRTAVGIDETGTKLILLVVDGRQPDLSIGMTLPELADEMLRAGCYNAMNLDGGGSSVLVLRDPATHQLRIMNSPSDTKERAVADALCVKVNVPISILSK